MTPVGTVWTVGHCRAHVGYMSGPAVGLSNRGSFGSLCAVYVNTILSTDTKTRSQTHNLDTHKSTCKTQHRDTATSLFKALHVRGASTALRPAANLGRVERPVGHSDSHAEAGRAGARQISSRTMSQKHQVALRVRCPAALGPWQGARAAQEAWRRRYLATAGAGHAQPGATTAAAKAEASCRRDSAAAAALPSASLAAAAAAAAASHVQHESRRILDFEAAAVEAVAVRRTYRLHWQPKAARCQARWCSSKLLPALLRFVSQPRSI